MDQIINWTDVGFRSLVALGESIMVKVPNILGAIFLLLLGWIIANIISFVIRGMLKAVGMNKLTERLNINELFKNANLKITPIDFIGKFIYWVVLLLFFVTATDVLGWGVVSNSIGDLINQLPLIFSAIVIFVVGLFIITFVRNAVKGMMDSLNISSSKLVSSSAYYILLVILTLTSLEQAGVNTSLLTANVVVIFGGVMAAFSISFALGSKEILNNIVSSFYSKSNFKVGQEVELADVRGTIEKIDQTSVVIATNEGKVVIPIKRLIEEKVTIKK